MAILINERLNGARFLLAHNKSSVIFMRLGFYGCVFHLREGMCSRNEPWNAGCMSCRMWFFAQPFFPHFPLKFNFFSTFTSPEFANDVVAATFQHRTITVQRRNTKHSHVERTKNHNIVHTHSAEVNSKLVTHRHRLQYAKVYISYSCCSVFEICNAERRKCVCHINILHRLLGLSRLGAKECLLHIHMRCTWCTTNSRSHPLPTHFVQNLIICKPSGVCMRQASEGKQKCRHCLCRSHFNRFVSSTRKFFHSFFSVWFLAARSFILFMCMYLYEYVRFGPYATHCTRITCVVADASVCVCGCKRRRCQRKYSRKKQERKKKNMQKM